MKSLIKFLHGKIWYLYFVFFTFLSIFNFFYRSFLFIQILSSILKLYWIILIWCRLNFQDNPINKISGVAIFRRYEEIVISPNLLDSDANVGLITVFELLVIGVTVASTDQHSINDLCIQRLTIRDLEMSGKQPFLPGFSQPRHIVLFQHESNTLCNVTPVAIR